MKKIPVSKKLVAVFLAIVMLFSMIPTFVFNASAAGGNITKVSDPSTVNDWKAFFGPNAKDTTWVGGVWSDKSVFTSVKDYTDATDESDDNINLAIGENNFLVALSAIASTKSIEGYSTLPTDTILVLDLSGSMDVTSGTDPYVTMVSSANNAIDKLLGLNAQNRVGVIAYSGNSNLGNSNANTATVILPLGRYTKGLDGNNNSVYLVSSWTERSGFSTVTRNGVKVANGVTGTKAAGVTSDFSTSNSKQVTGGTYTQNGIYKAYQMFDEVTDTTITDGVQAGTKRKPVMVLMSDGSPTAATTNYTNVGTSNCGDGSEENYGSVGISFMTQLTAAFAKDKIEEKYDNEALVYTLGLNVGNKDAALSLLNPSNNTATDSYWTTFKGLANGRDKDMSVNIRNNGNENKTITYTNPVNSEKGWSEDYVTQYFGANNTTQLNNAFQDIVEQIIVQSLYYPTLVDGGNSINHDGFLEFEDYIGKNMEVKAVKGIQLGSTLYDGRTLARMIMTGGMGSEQNPTEAGNNMVWAVMERMGITDTAVARQLIGEAYANGQLYYDAVTGEYSNYIGWYADGEGKYVGFWDGKDASPEAVPTALKGKAVFANKSYGYYDAVGEGHRKTDMMYATIVVRTTLLDTAEGKTDASEVGDIRLIGKLPASLIPLVEYDIQLEGTDPMNPSSMTIKGATAPSRLIYEVGLSSKIDILNIEATAPDTLEKNADGDYIFYTNQWHSIDNYAYSTNKNTTTWFEPSVENERYYYNIDSDIYTSKNGTLYRGATAPVYNENNPLYHRSIVYKESGGRVTAEWYYEEVSQYVLEDASDLTKRDDNSWYVKAGTIHHYFADYEREKEDNLTGTINYSDKPFVHEPNVGVTHEKYHIDSFLGNNGLLTLDAYEGIVISKFADSTITDRNQSYEFNVSADVDATLDLVIEDAQGVRTWSTISFDGSYTINLKHNEKAYILGDALIGKEVTVTENTSGKDYEVLSVNGDISAKNAVITVSDAVISPAAFVNTVPQDGDVVISKTVISTIDGHLDDEFTFEVTLTGTGEFDAVYTDGTTVKIIAGQTNTVRLAHNENLVIEALPKDTVVTVKEINIPDGFTPDSVTKTATVVVGQTQTLAFTNTYDAQDTDEANIGITVEKSLLNGNAPADWNGTFDFVVEEWNGTAYVPISDFEIDYSLGGTNKATVNVLKDKVYTDVGTYYYRIREIEDAQNIKNGIIYDTVYSRFSVTVIDDGSGKLKVASVNPIADTTVSGTDVTAVFNNGYQVNGAAEAVIDISKTVENIYGQTAKVQPAGFSFSLYEADSNYNITNNTAVATSATTGAAGTTRISVLYEDDVTNDYYYVLKEDNAGATINNVTYTDKTYNVKVSVKVENSYYSITVSIYDGDTLVDTASYTATEGDIIAVAEVEGANFTNTFTPESVVAVANLRGIKHLSGRNITEDDNFTFALYETGADYATADAPVLKIADWKTGIFNFGSLEYTKEGTHYYVIKEVIPQGAVNGKLDGVTYDTREYRIKIVVTGDAVTGALHSQASMTLYDGVNNTDAKAIIFTNTYTAEHTDATIIGTKTLNGGIRKLQAGAFRFELVENGQVIQTVSNGVPVGDYEAGFEFNLHYDTVGEHTYTVKEVIPQGAVNNKLNGVTYDATEYTVKVNVTDNGKGQLVAEVEYQNGNVAFVNDYSVEATSIVLPVKKELAGDNIAKHTFQFELYSATLVNGEFVKGNLIATVENGTDGIAEFSNLPELNFSTIGGYRFIIVEKAGTTALMDYDKAVYEVEINVTDNLSGQLIATPKYTRVTDTERIVANAVVFNNKYNEEPVVADIGGTKTYNKALTDGQFIFELYQALPDAQGKINAIGDAALIATNNAQGEFKFAEEEGTGYITYTKEGTYYYVIKEQIPENAVDNRLEGVNYDNTLYTVTVTVTKDTDATGRSILVTDVQYSDTVVFANTYTADKTEYAINGHKDLDGRDLAEKEFTFVLYENGVEIDRQTNDENGDFTFKTIEYTKADEYVYTVKEDATNKKGGVTYDEDVYTVTVKVTDDGKGVLSAAATYKVDTASRDSLLFENTYKADNVSHAIKGHKDLIGRDLAEKEFTFVLYENGVEIDRQTNDENGDFTFKTIEYTKADEYVYTVKEDATDKKGGVTYDEDVYTVTVKVTDNLKGSLEKEVTYKVENDSRSSLLFENAYAAEKISVAIGGKKILDGRDIRENEFTFVLTDKDGKEYTAKNNANGGFEFEAIEYTEIGEYVYTVKEDATEKAENITYDESVFTVTVKVTDNGEGKLVAEILYADGEEKADSIEFVNKYTEPVPEVPKTGDNFNDTVWLVLSSVSALAVLVLIGLKKKLCK